MKTERELRNIVATVSCVTRSHTKEVKKICVFTIERPIDIRLHTFCTQKYLRFFFLSFFVCIAEQESINQTE